MSLPIVSVVIPSYNHGDFLPKAIQSVLSQTVQNIEVIIVDDASNDHSALVIKNIRDPRVRSIIFEKNKGAATTLNTGILEAKAPFVAVCNSDDEWIRTKLADQLKIMEGCPSLGAVFSNVTWINDLGQEKSEGEILTYHVFNQKNRSRGAWLKHLVEKTNCLCHPSVLIKREVYEHCGLLNSRYIQMPDYDLWLRVTQKYPIFVMPEKTVRFRLHEDNVSNQSPANVTRAHNELATILENFMTHVDETSFAIAFGTKKPVTDPGFCLELEKVLYLTTRSICTEVILRDIGMKLFSNLLNKDNADKFLLAYGLSPNSYYTLLGLSSPWIDRRNLGPLTEKEKNLLSSICSEDEYESVLKNWVPINNLPEITQEIARVPEFGESPKMHELREHLIVSHGEFAQLVNSFPWTITKPLRVIKTFLTGKKKKHVLALVSEKANLTESDLNEIVTSLNEEIDEIKGSISWQITRPMQAISTLFM